MCCSRAESEGDGWVGERCGCSEPIGGSDVRAHGKVNGGGSVSDATLYDKTSPKVATNSLKELGGAGTEIC